MDWFYRPEAEAEAKKKKKKKTHKNSENMETAVSFQPYSIFW